MQVLVILKRRTACQVGSMFRWDTEYTVAGVETAAVMGVVATAAGLVVEGSAGWEVVDWAVVG